MPRKKTPPLFEEALAELEQLVEQMERGDLSLEESLKSFEHGVKLTSTCQKALRAVEQKVQSLITKNDKQTLQPLNNE